MYRTSIIMITDRIGNSISEIFFSFQTIAPTLNPSLIKIIFMIMFVIFVFVFYSIMSSDKQALGENFLGYVISFMIVVIIGSAMMFIELKDNSIYYAMGTLIVATILLIFNKKVFGSNAVSNIKHYFLSDYPVYPGMSKENSFIVAYSLKMILVLIILLALSIFYRFFLNQSYRQKGMIGFFIQFLFYIPCMINDYFDYLMKELQMTPFVVYVLLALEVILILAYFLIPIIFSKMSVENGKQLLKTPVFIHQRKTLDSCKYIMKHFVNDKGSWGNPSQKEPSLKKISGIINRQYAFSMWININTSTQMANNEIHSVFRYDDEQNVSAATDKPVGKPCIYYTSSENDNNTPQYHFVFSDKDSVNMTYTTELPAQKWNHVVFNYSNNKCDLFLNGKLTKTVYFKENAPDLTDADNIVIGQDSENVVGAICNVVVYKRPMTPEQIAYVYNINHLRNPPV